jgi:ATP-dependent Clp protease adaptor protein ClpS
MGRKQSHETDGDVAVMERASVSRSRPWNVIMHNDDFTTMEFVIYALKRFFNKDEDTAVHLTLEIHKKGSTVVGTFTRDVAETKVDIVMQCAKENGHPLRLTAEPGPADGDE